MAWLGYTSVALVVITFVGLPIEWALRWYRIHKRDD